MNGSYICSLRGFSPYDFLHVSNAVILHVNQGDTVSIVSHSGVENHLFGNPDHIFTTFSGGEIISDNDILMSGMLSIMCTNYNAFRYFVDTLYSI